MSKANSHAIKIYWASMSLEERQERSRKMNEARWSKMDAGARRRHALKMVRARKKKKKK